MNITLPIKEIISFLFIIYCVLTAGIRIATNGFGLEEYKIFYSLEARKRDWNFGTMFLTIPHIKTNL